MLVFVAAGLATAWAAPNLVLVSMDTTRADALGCYGGLPGFEGQQVTPNLDAIAAEGVRFERFWTHAPTTLSSHTTMMSGLDPHGHAVVRNGFPVLPETRTLAQRLAEVGYDTLAVVGASALERAMGLDRGFRVYDDETLEHFGPAFQRRAEHVVGRTFELLDAREPADRPLFLFVHLYDPHTPYDAPEPFRDRYTDPAYAGPYRDEAAPKQGLRQQLARGQADPAHGRFLDGRYLGEVAYMDAWIGQLVEGLGARGLLDEAVLVLTADHGENLSDFPQMAWSHGSDVGLGVMRVPLIVRGYGVPMAERAVVQRQAAMSGLAPTLEIALGLEPTLGDGLHFWDLLRPGPVLDVDGWPERPTIPAFLEATRPRQLEPPDGWNNLAFFRGVQAGGWGAYAAPCYDLPWTFYDGFTRPDEPAILPFLEGMMAAWDQAAPPRREAEMAPATKQALQALGYLE